MSILDDLWLRPILVEPHARTRIRDRLGWDDDDRVVGEVRVALLEGRASESDPPWTRYRARPVDYRTQKGRLYAWDVLFLRCWVLQRADGGIYVVTVLLEQAERAAYAQRRLLRA